MSISREALIKALRSAGATETSVTNARRTNRLGRTARRRAVRNEGDEEVGESEGLDDLVDGDIEIGDKVTIELDPEETVEVTGTVVAPVEDEEGEDAEEYEEVTTDNARRPRYRRVKNARLVCNGKGGYTVLAPVSKKYRKVTKNSRWARIVRNADNGLDGRYTSTGDVPSGYDEPEESYASELKGVDKPDWNAGAVENRRRIMNARKARAYDAIVARARRIRNEEDFNRALENKFDEMCRKRFGGGSGSGSGLIGNKRVRNSRKAIGSFRIKNYRLFNEDGDDITAEAMSGQTQPQPEDQQVIQLELVIDGGQDIQPEDISVDVAGEGVPQVEEPTADPGVNDQGQAAMLPEDENVQNCGRVRNARRRIRNARRRFAAVKNEETVVNNAASTDSAPLDVPSTFPEAK